MDRPAYYALIPANVRYADIPPNAKLLYGEITALTSKEGYCWASNEYFAKLYGVQLTTVSEWVKILSERGFIRCVFVGRNLRHIYIFDSEKTESVIREKPKADSGKAEHSITSNTKENTGVAIAPLPSGVKFNPGGEEPPQLSKSTAKYPNARKAFKWFPEVDPAWDINSTELKAAVILFEKGEEKVRKNIKYCQPLLGVDGFPIQRLTPYLLTTNWERIYEYSKRG